MHTNILPLKATLISLGLAAMLAILPDSASAALRDVVRWLLVPGQKSAIAAHDRIGLAVRQKLSQQLDRQARELDDLRQVVSDARRRERQARLVTTQTLQELSNERQRPRGIDVESGVPLFSPKAIDARVVGQELISQWKSKRLLDLGTRDGVHDDQWVLEAHRLTIDQGEHASIGPGLMVFAGQNILGRVAESGRFVSAIELITDRSFRSTATVGRTAGEQVSFTTAGLLEGDGNGQCRLTQVPASESVAVGDNVYSVPSPQSVDTPMLFGQVVSATAGALHWEIVVRPEIDASRLRTVQVLTTSFNPTRLMGLK